MIVSCSRCQTKYNVDERQVQGGRVLLRCPVCRTWFSVAVVTEPVEPPVSESSAIEEAKIPESTAEAESDGAQTEPEAFHPTASQEDSHPDEPTAPVTEDTE